MHGACALSLTVEPSHAEECRSMISRPSGYRQNRDSYVRALTNFCDKRVYSHHLHLNTFPTRTQARKHASTYACLFAFGSLAPSFWGGRSCTDKDDFCCNWKKTLLNRNTTIRKTDRHPKTKQPTLALFQSSPSPLPISPESKETTKIGKDKVCNTLILYHLVFPELLLFFSSFFLILSLFLLLVHSS